MKYLAVVALASMLFVTGCAALQSNLTDANAAAIESLTAQANKLPVGSPERVKIEQAIAELQKAQATGFDPVGLLLAFGGAHSQFIYGAAGLSALLAAVAAWNKNKGSAAPAEPAKP